MRRGISQTWVLVPATPHWLQQRSAQPPPHTADVCPGRRCGARSAATARSQSPFQRPWLSPPALPIPGCSRRWRRCAPSCSWPAPVVPVWRPCSSRIARKPAGRPRVPLLRPDRAPLQRRHPPLHRRRSGLPRQSDRPGVEAGLSAIRLPAEICEVPLAAFCAGSSADMAFGRITL